MVKKNIKKFLKNGNTIFLPYDQGLEHGPTDFNNKNVDPKYIIEIAKKSKLNALVFQKGIAEKYKKEIKKSKIHLMIKLNGKTNLVKGDPISRQICSVEEAKNLGAIGVGYTIYLGSIHESKMLQEFSKIEKEATKLGLVTMIWMYPRGKSIKRKSKTKLMAYATRVALELDADFVKIKYEGNKKDLEWAVKAAGKTKVILSGGVKKKEKKLLKEIKDLKNVSGTGLAYGRNIWQSKNPHTLIKKIKKILFTQ
jgi:class I fructose-bisphosphate aldolase